MRSRRGAWVLLQLYEDERTPDPAVRPVTNLAVRSSSHNLAFSTANTRRIIDRARAALRERERERYRSLRHRDYRQDHASGRRAQQPAQQAAEDQRRARGGQGSEETVQVRQRLHGIPRAVASRDQAVRTDLQQVSICVARSRDREREKCTI